MNEQELEKWEGQVRSISRSLPYPPTPDMARATRERLFAAASPAAQSRGGWRGALQVAGAIAALLLAFVLSLPQVRAEVVEFLQIGAIRVQLVEPTPTPPAPPEGREEPAVLLGTRPIPPSDLTTLELTTTPRRTMPVSTPTYLTSVLELAGQTTLAEARSQVEFPIYLPTYPPDLDEPDRVYVQELGAPAVVLVWTEPDDPERARISLQLIGREVTGYKSGPEIVQETMVNGKRALWLRGPHLLQLGSADTSTRDVVTRLVQGDVLLWHEGGITYRLEADVPMEEAVRIAESLR